MASTTPKYGITTPDYSTQFKDLGRELQEMGESIEQVLSTFDYNGADPEQVLSRVAALELQIIPMQDKINALEIATQDTGWVNIPRLPGINRQGTSEPQARRVGNLVTLKWGVSSSGVSGSTDLATLPMQFRHNTSMKYFTIAGSSSSVHVLVIDSAGKISVRPGGSSSYFIFDNVSFLLDEES